MVILQWKALTLCVSHCWERGTSTSAFYHVIDFVNTVNKYYLNKNTDSFLCDWKISIQNKSFRLLKTSKDVQLNVSIISIWWEFVLRDKIGIEQTECSDIRRDIQNGCNNISYIYTHIYHLCRVFYQNSRGRGVRIPDKWTTWILLRKNNIIRFTINLHVLLWTSPENTIEFGDFL